jgi:hypothetical protein
LGFRLGVRTCRPDLEPVKIGRQWFAAVRLTFWLRLQNLPDHEAVGED